MKKNLYAVLIGINKYHSKPLAGCINDALAVQDYLRELYGDRFIPLFLLAPNTADLSALALRGIDNYKCPTRQNIIDSFEHFLQAEAGDGCLFYYCGHGSTAIAPDAWKGYEPHDLLQTIVCADSRIEGVPDLLDKELGYLIAKVMDARPDVHFLTVSDCCHSGTNTRDADDSTQVRMQPRGIAPLIAEGFNPGGNCYYAPFAPGQTAVNPNGGVRHARHTSLAAARDSELAKELDFPKPGGGTVRHGVFTACLLDILREAGTAMTYAELVQQVETAVRARVVQQIPQLRRTVPGDEFALFLGGGTSAPVPVFPIMYDQFLCKWIIKAGEIHGLTMPGGRVRLKDREVAIVAVEPTYAVLDSKAFTKEERGVLNLTAPLPVSEKCINIGLGKAINDAQMAEITREFDAQAPVYAQLATQASAAQYFIDYSKGKWIIALPDSDRPLWPPIGDAGLFVENIAKMTRHLQVLSLANPWSTIPSDAIAITVKKLENTAFDPATLGEISADQFASIPHQSAAFPYPARVFLDASSGLQPAIQVRISAKNGAYWVGAMFCDEEYGIETGFLPVQQIGGENQAPYADLKFHHNGFDFLSIPLSTQKNDGTKPEGDLIRGHLIILVANESFYLEQFQQECVVTTRSRTGAGFDAKNVLKKSNWRVIKIPVEVMLA